MVGGIKAVHKLVNDLIGKRLYFAVDKAVIDRTVLLGHRSEIVEGIAIVLGGGRVYVGKALYHLRVSGEVREHIEVSRNEKGKVCKAGGVLAQKLCALDLTVIAKAEVSIHKHEALARGDGKPEGTRRQRRHRGDDEDRHCTGCLRL